MAHGETTWPINQKAEDMDISCDSQGARYCVLCDYEAEDMYDLEAHTWSEHDEVEQVNHKGRSLDEGFLCKLCPKWFQREIELKAHFGDHSNLLSCGSGYPK